VAVLDLEARRAGASYTVETLEALTRRHPDDLFWVMIGADNLLDFATWHRPERILALARLLVFPRGGLEPRLPVELAERAEIVVGFSAPVSSTDVRARLAAGELPVGLMPAAVLAYVEERGLYRHSPRPPAADPRRKASGSCP
jgi:nicotinate-nucleotide adenylyltransferase